MAKKFLATAIMMAMALTYAPVSLFAGQAQGASIAGTATNSAGQTLANTTVQLRNLVTGQLTGTATSSASGAFSFTGLPVGQFSVEIVNAAGQVIGTSAAITTTAGLAVTGVTVAASAGAIIGGAAAAGGIGGAFFGTTAGIVTAVAVGAGVTAAVVAVTNDASASE